MGNQQHHTMKRFLLEKIQRGIIILLLKQIQLLIEDNLSHLLALNEVRNLHLCPALSCWKSFSPSSIMFAFPVLVCLSFQEVNHKANNICAVPLMR
jgi:hypothetical protein